MDSLDQARLVLQRLLTERRKLPRPAAHFLDGLLADEELLARMRFCRPEERQLLRNTVLISLEDGTCWAVMLGNDPEGPSRVRPRLALEGLDLTPQEVLQRLRPLPIWFLALDPAYVAPEPGAAVKAEQTGYRLASLPFERLRRLALTDQLDAALEAGDHEACRRIRSQLLGE